MRISSPVCSGRRASSGFGAIARVAADSRPGASADPYKNPELFRWAGSMEGIPAAATDAGGRPPWRDLGNQWLGWVGSVLPGVSIAIVLALVGRIAAEWAGTSLLGFAESPISPILLAILLGLGIRNSIGIPAIYDVGLQLCLKRILRIGVALLGIRLSLSAVGTIGLLALPIVVASIVAALLLVSAMTRAIGLPRRLGTLIAVGTAICGNTAVVATAPLIGAEKDETSYAIGCVTLFGLLALIGYPFLSHWLFAGDPLLAGLFLGTAIHDTAQVAGAGMLYLQQFGSQEALDAATVTKLLRNLFMLLVIPLMGVVYARSGTGSAMGSRPRFFQMVPFFVFGFVALAVVRTLGDLGATPFDGRLSEADWHELLGGASLASAWCLAVAMAAVGLGTNLKRLRVLGLKPLAVGLTAALVVGALSATLIHLLAPWIGSV